MTDEDHEARIGALCLEIEDLQQKNARLREDNARLLREVDERDGLLHVTKLSVEYVESLEERVERLREYNARLQARCQAHEENIARMDKLDRLAAQQIGRLSERLREVNAALYDPETHGYESGSESDFDVVEQARLLKADNARLQRENAELKAVLNAPGNTTMEGIKRVMDERDRLSERVRELEEVLTATSLHEHVHIPADLRERVREMASTNPYLWDRASRRVAGLLLRDLLEHMEGA